MSEIRVEGAAPYSVHLGERMEGKVARCAAKLGAQRAVMYAQPAVLTAAQKISTELERIGIRSTIVTVPDAEQAKTPQNLLAAWERLGELGITRGDVIIGVGGGAVTDFAGFVAATWMRGIPVIQVPTTLLGMVDAAVGGKTGINLTAGKNLVGAFHEPAGVFLDTFALRSLPRAELVAGSAEIIKTGFIRDPRILELYENDPESCLDVDGALPELIQRSVAVKAEVAGRDLKESGLREILNYGHTFGHAVEQAEDYRWRHGNAVAVGMMYVAHLAHARGLVGKDLVSRHRDILASVGLPTGYAKTPFDQLLTVMRRDKKVRRGVIRFVALAGVGNVVRIEDATDAEMESAYLAVAREGSRQIHPR
ncbi:3-dehydroquinate synthase [Corynebacterium massiliense]|uniref:3-dehydroquinate synthase n=1 Tax=Corynebacterium massiliense DSM 45435 TaxID=1121364 RepID=A0ABY7UA13_9CORY|nr:3-dehydroquinate synthase [Corynebacterium massiliense]WCZ32593.1 3-dehydroquinate synthase [Corynebacterium massiliense DSM 45435]